MTTVGDDKSRASSTSLPFTVARPTSDDATLAMSSKKESTPVVEPIQKPVSVPTSDPAATTSRSGNATDTKPINPSPVVDEGPAGGADIPSHQVRSSGAERSGTQDALRGQGNSATVATFSREDYAPVSRSQRQDDSEYKKAQDEGRMTQAGGDTDFRQSDARGKDEPEPGRVSDPPPFPHPCQRPPLCYSYRNPRAERMEGNEGRATLPRPAVQIHVLMLRFLFLELEHGGEHSPKPIATRTRIWLKPEQIWQELAALIPE